MGPFTGMDHDPVEAPNFYCVECQQAVCHTSVPYECRVPHCDHTMLLHRECADQRDPLLCCHHQQCYQQQRLKRWVIGWGCALLLLGGTVATGYGSAILANHIGGYFAYAPVVLLPHRMQVLIHGLGWLVLGGGVLTAWDYFYPPRSSRDPRPIEATTSASGSAPAADSSTVVHHHHHHHHEDTNWGMMSWLMATNRPSVVIHNNNTAHGSNVTTQADDEHKTEAYTPSGVVNYRSPGWGPLLALGAGAAWGVYKLWKTLYATGCRYWQADFATL